MWSRSSGATLPFWSCSHTSGLCSCSVNVSTSTSSSLIFSSASSRSSSSSSLRTWRQRSEVRGVKNSRRRGPPLGVEAAALLQRPLAPLDFGLLLLQLQVPLAQLLLLLQQLRRREHEARVEAHHTHHTRTPPGSTWTTHHVFDLRHLLLLEALQLIQGERHAVGQPPSAGLVGLVLVLQLLDGCWAERERTRGDGNPPGEGTSHSGAALAAVRIQMKKRFHPTSREAGKAERGMQRGATPGQRARRPPGTLTGPPTSPEGPHRPHDGLEQ
ncbi:hypothetical protein EYF80_033352 [Liparis tanakae]|uniref:Uncharacterized protein n=1 Tax=Liparis tanakae TaxID=230148 RepID=A0A4Z2GUK2_9TELE|nr:hypothetical protein EYF80_033352 [Liparis tanakae]